MSPPVDSDWLECAARLALRGHGGAEPNPLVGCVIVQPGAPRSSQVVGYGYHARCGEPHAEAIALARAGERANGATAYVTLEPCAHQGRTPPCTEALIRQGIARVVYSVADPNPVAAGGATQLHDAGIEVQRIECMACTRVTAPFLTRIHLRRPWVIAKWAQTLDGRTATRAGDSRWISGTRSRAAVHRERGRVDAVMVGVGTVLADDPHLLPRVTRTRRTPRRIIIDPQLATPIDAQIIKTASQGSVTIVALASAIASAVQGYRGGLVAAGVSLMELAPARGEAGYHAFRGLPRGSMAEVLRSLGSQGVSTVLVEGGAGLLGALFDEDLVDDAWAFTAPVAVADGSGRPVATGKGRMQMLDALKYQLLDLRRRGDDSVALWRRATHG